MIAFCVMLCGKLRHFASVALCAALVFAFFLPAPIAIASQNVTLSGKINAAPGDAVNIVQAVLKDGSTVIAKVTNPQAGQPFALQVPSGLPFIFNIWQQSGTASATWSTTLTLNRDTNIEISLPTSVVFQGLLVDSFGSPISSSGVSWSETGMQTRGGMQFTDSSANVWTSGGVTSRTITSSSGTFSFNGFPSSERSRIRVITPGNQSWLSSSILISKNEQLLICINTSGVSVFKPTSGTCLPSAVEEAIAAEKAAAEKAAAEKAAAEKAAAEKAAAEKAAAEKAAAEKAAAEKAAAEKAALKKKVTVTCVKGKVLKKVTAKKPKCPRGFKLKR